MLSILIVSYNRSENTVRLVETLLNENLRDDFEILIHDNASHPVEIQKLEIYLADYKHKPVHFVKGKINTGYGAAVNVLARIAKGENFLILNNDVIFTNHALQKFYQEFLQNSPHSITSSKVKNSQGEYQNTGYYFPRIKSKVMELAAFFFPGIFKPDYYAACCWLISKTIFQKLNRFDESFFMYGEDADFVFRAKNSGIKINQSSEGEIIHNSKGSERNYIHLFRFLILQTRGKICFQKKNCSWVEQNILLFVSLSHCFFRILFSPQKKKYRALFTLHIGQFQKFKKRKFNAECTE